MKASPRSGWVAVESPASAGSRTESSRTVGAVRVTRTRRG